MKRKAKEKPLQTRPGAREMSLSAWARLEGLYRRLPKLPLLDKDTSAIAIISILVYLAFVAFAYFSSPQEQLHAIIKEGGISKNTPLMLLAGESYSYEISSGGSLVRLDYEIRSSKDCSGRLVVETGEQGAQNAACITPEGNLQGDIFNMNSTLGNQSLLLFSPWMLAVSEDFSWQVENTISTGSANIKMPVRFQSQGLSQAGGRQAYEILVQSDFTLPVKYYVDSEKRILILAEMGNASARLVSAPFALNWTK